MATYSRKEYKEKIGVRKGNSKNGS